jgi:hypothetical protein
VYLFGPITGAVIASSAYKRHSKIFTMMTVPEPIEPVAVKVAYHDDEFRKAE